MQDRWYRWRQTSKPEPDLCRERKKNLSCSPLIASVVPEVHVSLGCSVGSFWWVRRSTSPHVWESDPLWAATTNTTTTALGWCFLVPSPQSALLHISSHSFPLFTACFRDCVFLCALQIGAGIFVSCIVASFVGFVFQAEGLPVDDVMEGGGLIFTCLESKIIGVIFRYTHNVLL